MVLPVDEQLGGNMDLLDTVLGTGLAVLIFLVGAVMGYLFCAYREPPPPAGESFARDMVIHTMAQNDRYANQVLAISDNALDRMRIERETPAPKVDDALSLADTILLQTRHDTEIPHRSGGPMD